MNQTSETSATVEAILEAREETIHTQHAVDPDLTTQNTFIWEISKREKVEMEGLYNQYPLGWDEPVSGSEKSCESIYHEAELACVRGELEKALIAYEQLETIIESMEEGVLKDRYMARLYMLDAIVYRVHGDSTIDNPKRREWLYTSSEQSFIKAAELAIQHKDIPTLLEVQAHAVRTQMSLEQFTLALASAIEALVYAGKLGRKDSQFFTKTVLKAKPNLRQLAILSFLNTYFVKGCVQIVTNETKKRLKRS